MHRSGLLVSGLAFLVLWVSPGPAAAQSAFAGYAFVAPGQARIGGDSTTTVHLGGGGEWQLRDRRLGIGAEVGFLGPTESFGDGLGVFSVNGTWHVLGRNPSRLVPFVTGGYSMIFREGHANGGNFGGGVEFWVRPRHALRLEIRDHVFSESGETAQFWGVRIGYSFR